MTTSSNRPVATLEHTSALLGLFSLMLGVAVLASYRIASQAHPPWPPMMPNAALCCALAGLALVLLRRGPGGSLSAAPRRIALALALLVSVIAAVTMAEDVFGLDSGLDEILVRGAAVNPETRHPGRMPPTVAASFLFLGVGLWALALGPEHATAGQVLAAAAGIVDFLAVLGYAYDVRAFVRIGLLTQVAPFTIVGLAALSLGTLLVRSDGGIMEAFTLDSEGGRLARQLVPVLLGVPVLMGVLRSVASQRRLVDPALGLCLAIAGTAVACVWLVVRKARVTHDLDMARRHSEWAAAESERFRRLVELMPTAVVVHSDRRLVFANSAAGRLLGAASAGDLTGRPVEELFDEANRPAVRERLAKLEAGEVVAHAELTLAHPAGEGIHTSVESAAITYLGRSAVQEVLHDVTETRHSFETVKEALEISELVASVSMMATRADEPQALLSSCARTIVDRLGLSGASVWVCVDRGRSIELAAVAGVALQHHLGSRLPLGETVVGRVAMDRVPITGAPAGDLPPEWAGGPGLAAFAVYPLRCEDRIEGVLAVGSKTPLGETIHRALGAVVDVLALGVRRRSEAAALGRSERRLVESQKMKAVVTLATGVAHHFNNLLQVALGHLELLASEIPKGAPGHESSVAIGRTLRRGAELVRQMMVLGRVTSTKPVVLRFSGVVEAVSQMVQSMVGALIRVDFAEEGDAGLVEIDPADLEQLVFNLAINARDAMPRGGTLSIRVSAIDVDSPSSGGGLPDLPGSYVKLTVGDTGCGMGPEILTHLYEPFFTTKPPDKGTGLGLSIVYSIVQRSRGHVAVESREGAGTTFTLFFPRVAAGKSLDQAAVRLDPTAPAARPPAGGETVLVVEDESDVRDVLCSHLRRAGFGVLSAGGGVEALALAQRSEGRIDLVLTDVVMPDGGGVELARRLAQTHPSIKVVFITGYSEESLEAIGASTGGAPVLRKPCRQSEIVGRLREVLDGPPGSV